MIAAARDKRMISTTCLRYGKFGKESETMSDDSKATASSSDLLTEFCITSADMSLRGEGARRKKFMLEKVQHMLFALFIAKSRSRGRLVSSHIRSPYETTQLSYRLSHHISRAFKRAR